MANIVNSLAWYSNFEYFVLKKRAKHPLVFFAIEKNRFTGTRFTCEHSETGLKDKLEAVDQSDVPQLKTGEHSQLLWSCRP